MKHLALFLLVLFAACSTPCPQQQVQAFASIPVVDSANIDVVCGGGKAMLSGSKLSSVYKGKTWKFCSATCKDSFVKQPNKFVK